MTTNHVKPIDFIQPENQAMLADIQGNILKGHGREHSTHIFIRFNANSRKTALRWIKKFAENYVYSCKKQLQERELYKRNNVPGGTFVSFFLTAAGYNHLGFTDYATQFKDDSFIKGMQSKITDNKDPDVTKWEPGFRESLHAMVLLADDNVNRMGILAKELLKSLDNCSSIKCIEYGHAIRNANGDGLEHFGYVDGVSQPLFLKDEVDAYMSFHSTTHENAAFNPTAAKELVLEKDPYGKDENALGSYFVFRKLEQHVKDFKAKEKKVGREIYKDEKDEEKREIAGAYLVGRFEDGTPVVLNNDEGLIGAGNYNNFNYNNDSGGSRCPHFAHIRKVNPRTIESNSRIMARRGIPFGRRNVDTAIDPCPQQLPEDGVGLLFMSYQASIINQFEWIQQKFANDQANGIDSIIGQDKNGTKHTHNYPKEYGSDERTPEIEFNQFVHMKGGEYFFAPSISFLTSL